jgi:hypothetical protein
MSARLDEGVNIQGIYEQRISENHTMHSYKHWKYIHMHKNIIMHFLFRPYIQLSQPKKLNNKTGTETSPF